MEKSVWDPMIRAAVRTKSICTEILWRIIQLDPCGSRKKKLQIRIQFLAERGRDTQKEGHWLALMKKTPRKNGTQLDCRPVLRQITSTTNTTRPTEPMRDRCIRFSEKMEDRMALRSRQK